MKKAKIITGLFLMCAVLLLATGCEGAYGSVVVSNDGFDETGLIKLWDAGAIWDGTAAGTAAWTPRLLEIDDWADQTRAELTFLVEPYGAGITDGYYQFKPCSDASQTSFAGSVLNNNGVWQLLNKAGSYSFMPTTADWALIKANGMYFDGTGVKLTAVYISEAPATDDGKQTVTAPYTGTFRTGPEGDGSLTLAAANFPSDMVIGVAKLEVNYTLGSTAGVDSYVTIKSNAPAWQNKLAFINTKVTAAGKATLEMNAALAVELSTYGAVVTGKNIVVTGVTFVNFIPTTVIKEIIVTGLTDKVGETLTVKDSANGWAAFGSAVIAADGSCTITLATGVTYQNQSKLYPEITGAETTYGWADNALVTTGGAVIITNSIDVCAANLGASVNARLTLVMSGSQVTSVTLAAM